MRNLLPFVAFLACPLMMIWCMRSMRGHGSSEEGSREETTQETALKEDLAELREEVAMLRAQSALDPSKDPSSH